jgi:hypothetical protein
MTRAADLPDKSHAAQRSESHPAKAAELISGVL